MATSDFEFNRVLTKSAPDLADKVNVHDPSGVPRDQKKRIVKCFAGVHAEALIQRFLKDKLVNLPQGDEHEIVSPPANYSFGQTDLRIIWKADRKVYTTIEIRSSYSYLARTMDDVIKGSMSLLGPYTTVIKKKELLKDYYLTCIHRIEPSYIRSFTGERRIDTRSPKVTEAIYEHLCESGLTSHYVGGETVDGFLNSNRSMVDDLFQEGAKYKVIRPICAGLDAVEVSEHAMKHHISKCSP